MPQSRKSNLQKKNILKGGLRNLLVLSQCWMVGLSCRFWGRYPQGHPLEVTCPKDVCIQDLLVPAEVRHRQLIGGKISHFLGAFWWAPTSLTELGHKIRIWPSLFPGGPFLLENFLSVEDQREHSPTHSTQHDLKMTHSICPDTLSQSYILPLHSFLMAGRKCWGQNQVSNVSKLKHLPWDGKDTHPSVFTFHSPECFAEGASQPYYKKSRKDGLSEHD